MRQKVSMTTSYVVTHSWTYAPPTAATRAGTRMPDEEGFRLLGRQGLSGLEWIIQLERHIGEMCSLLA